MNSVAARLGCIFLLVLTGMSLAHAERKTTYYHTDGLGSVVAASNDAGALLWRKEYAPFGEQLDSTAENEKLAYTGKQHDDVTGLTYFGARYYDPHLGRFMGVDPVGFVETNPMSFNRYAYGNDNPYKYVDPDGEFVNFAAKFVLDVGINIAFNYVTTGQMDVGGALKESAVGILNPAKTVAKAGKLGMALTKASTKAGKLPCPLSCFVAGTTVLAEDGFVAIETLEAGDLVWAHDPETGTTQLKPIVRTFVNTKDSVWELTLEKNGTRYRHEVTGSHPYYVVSAGWVEVAHLQLGAVLQAEGESTATVTAVRDTGQVLTTYNFEVADIHTYYVSAAKVLVHNCGGKKGLVDLTEHRKRHILDGDSKGGGHRHGTGKSGKTEFPANWDDGKILHEISDVATDPKAQRGVGKWGAQWARGTRDGVDIHVDFYPPNSKHAGKISTGYPRNAKPNP